MKYLKPILLICVISFLFLGARFAAIAPSGSPQTRRPTGDGNATYTPSTGSNWENVDEESADDDATYNYRQNSAGYDRFTFTAFSVPGGASNIAITVYIRAKRTEAGANVTYALLRVNGSNYTENIADAGTSYANQSHEWTTNPDTSSAWTIDDINGSGSNPLEQFGYGVTGNGEGEEHDVTQCYAVVSWD